MKKILTAMAVTAVSAAAANAAPITFFDEVEMPGASVPASVSAAQTDFLNGLSGVGTEDFETATLPNIAFAGSVGVINATLAGSASILSTPTTGSFATSGSSYVQTTGGGDFTISFSSAIAAFGFYGTDIGDIDNSLVLQLTKTGGGTVDLNVGNTVGADSGSVLFFGLIDTVDTYTSIAFLNQGGNGDVFGFDDMIIGDIGQVIVTPPTGGTNPVPLPAAGFLLMGALGGMGLARRRKS